MAGRRHRKQARLDGDLLVVACQAAILRIQTMDQRAAMHRERLLRGQWKRAGFHASF